MLQRCRSTWALLATLLLVQPLAARDLELSLSLGSGYPVKPDLHLGAADASGTNTSVQTRFQGPWLLAGAHVNAEVYKIQAWKFWAGAGYVSGLGSPAYAKLGQTTGQNSLGTTENLNGSATYSRYQFGAGATLGTGTIGEYGVYLWRRTNRIGLKGTLDTYQDQEGPQSGSQGGTLVKTSAGTSTSSTASDFMLEFSMGFVQTRPTFKTFERISFGTAFGPGYGNVGAQDWQLAPAFNDRLRPTIEIRFAYGVRL